MKSPVNLSVSLPGLGKIKNPVLTASGTFGFGYEYARFYDLNILGGMVLKATSLRPRFGNPLPRIAEAPAGMLNSIGLQNPGVKKILTQELERLRPLYQGKVMLNIVGETVADYLKVCAQIPPHDHLIGALEINVSCPNVAAGGMAFGVDPQQVETLTKKITRVTSLPVYLKLSPNVTDIVTIAKAAEAGGAAGLSLINTLVGMRLHPQTGKPIIANKIGGLSGPAIFPVAVRMVFQVSQAVKIPVIGVGGISSPSDVLEMISAGATAVQIGTANLVNPWACAEIIAALPAAMQKINLTSINQIIGRAWQ